MKLLVLISLAFTAASAKADSSSVEELQTEIIRLQNAYKT